MKLSALVVLAFGLICTNVYAETQAQTAVPAPSAAASSQETKNQAEGDAFLTANKVKPEVVTLADGLQYKIIKEGTGPTPGIDDTVTVSYSGRFIDGTEFDSSEKHGQPSVSFPVKAVIPGWIEALQKMKVGSTWEVYVPASLAYGVNGMPPVIGPNQALIFTITLLDVKKAGQ